MPSVQRTLLAALLLGGSAHELATAFAPSSMHPVSSSKTESVTALSAGGFGGGASTARKSKGSKKKKAAAVSSVPAFDVNASLLRLEKVYDELSQADAKRLADDSDDWTEDDRITSEYVVTVRPSNGNLDWVPIGQMLIARKLSTYDHDDEDDEDDEAINKPLMHATVSLYCRELARMAVLASRVGYSNVPRNELQYAVEPAGSWHKHVYDAILEENKKGEVTMTRTEAATILGFDDVSDVDRSSLKQAYRSLSMKWHPDRLLDLSEEEAQAGADKYFQIKQAYEKMLSASSGSWYESLGGKERTDFIKFDSQLLSIGKAHQIVEAQDLQSAVVPLDPELVQGFVARSMSR